MAWSPLSIPMEFEPSPVRHIVLGVIGLMLTLVVPVPPAMLDALLALNIASGLMLLLVAMNVKASAEMSTFPTILLCSALFRLGINVASTRLILTEGKAGTSIDAYVTNSPITIGTTQYVCTGWTMQAIRCIMSVVLRLHTPGRIIFDPPPQPAEM